MCQDPLRMRVWEARVFRGRASGHHVRAGADPHVAEERCRAPLEWMLRLRLPVVSYADEEVFQNVFVPLSQLIHW